MGSLNLLLYLITNKVYHLGMFYYMQDEVKVGECPFIRFHQKPFQKHFQFILLKQSCLIIPKVC